MQHLPQLCLYLVYHPSNDSTCDHLYRLAEKISNYSNTNMADKYQLKDKYENSRRRNTYNACHTSISTYTMIKVDEVYIRAVDTLRRQGERRRTGA